MSHDSDAIQTFQAITENYDEAVAVEYLSRHNWDVIGASNEFIANQGADRPPVAPVPRQDRQQQPQPQVDTRGWIKYIWDGVSWAGWSAVGLLGSLVGSIFWARRPHRDIPVSQGLEAHIRDSCPDANLPPFEALGYERASDVAFRDSQPLLVYLYTPMHSPQYLSEVLFSPAAASIMRENFTVALLDDAHPDYRALAEKTQLVPPPVLVAVHLITREQHAILGTLAETASAAEVIEFLDRTLMQDEFVTRETSERSVPRPTSQEKIIQDRLLRQEQEAAFREAERLAQERERSEQAERQRRQQAEAARITAQQEKQREKEAKKAQLPPEPVDGPNTAKIAFRLPDGAKIQRNFSKEDTVATLYLYIDTLDTELPQYELATSFPSHSLSDRSNSLEREGLWPRAVLHVREVS